MKKTVLIFVTIILFSSCARIMSNMVGQMIAPLTNTDLLSLQQNLMIYHLVRSAWPNQLDSYISFCDSLKIKRSENFETIDFLSHNDSLEVNYQLRYLQNDSVHSKILKGAFMIAMPNDSSMKINHHPEYAEYTDGTKVVWGSSNMNTQQPKQGEINNIKKEKSNKTKRKSSNNLDQ